MPEPLHPQLPRAQHGGPGAEGTTVLDFSVNSNPYGPNPLLVHAAREADPGAYPDPAYTDVRERLAGMHGVTRPEVVLAVGASMLLLRLAHAYLRPGDVAVSVGPPFGEFVRAVALTRAELRTLPPGEAPGQLPPGTRLVYVSRPNNPLGFALPLPDLRRLADTCGAVGALLIVDEAYAPMSPDLPALEGHPAAVRLLSPGKAHGVVGLRPAYALAAPAVAGALRNLAPAWELPAATAAVLHALPDAGDFLTETLPRWQRDADGLARALSGLAVVHHVGLPYFTLELEHAKRVTAALLARGVRVRDCASYGLPGRVRICARTPEDNERLTLELQEVLDG